MATLKKGRVVKVKHSPYEIESLKKQGWTLVTDTTVQEQAEIVTVNIPDPKVEIVTEQEPEPKSKDE
jgi:ketol-acid reductoisomerase